MTAPSPGIARHPCHRRLLTVALLLGLQCDLPAQPGTDRPTERFEVGLARSCFPNINLNDAVAAYRVILQNLGRRRGYEITPVVTIYDDTPQFEAAIKRGTVHLAVMDTWQYLDMERLPEIRPAFVPAINGRVGRRFVVLARRGSGIRTVADLRGRDVIMLESVNNNVCRHWLETLPPDSRAHPSAAFFAKLEIAAKPTAAVLPVFFGQKAACIVDEASFQLMVELNPQVGSVLQVVATSHVFADIVICLGEQNWISREAKTDAVNTLANLDADTAGRQILTLFKISGQVRFQAAQLRTVRALRRTLQQSPGLADAGGTLPMKLPPIGITLRTALLSWSVTLATLLIFVAVILPWQRSNFMANLESKAHGVAVSLREVAAGAAVNEDYSSVVDHCKEMLAGDDSLAYLVFTKNDGFSLIQDRAGWRSENNMPREWRPEKREPVSGIRFVPLFQQRVFSYSQPFDYSGIQWGWIHVGLSLDSYDRSVARLYRLTAIMGIACGMLSLLASFLYARRLVRPLLNLRVTVQRVAAGDLSARAEAGRSDELGSLAISVNSMTEALVRRDEILGSVQFAAQRFLGTGNWRDAIDEVLARIGRAARVSRAYVIEIQPAPDGQVAMQSCSEWVAPDAVGSGGQPLPPSQLGDLAQSEHWAAALQRGEVIATLVSELPEKQRAVFAHREVRSLFVIPIMVDRAWWGYLGFDDCARERHWSDAERDSLLAAADMLGAAIDRQRAQDALLDAKATLEQRVLDRTEALQRENLERKEAEAALARSLSVINATLESTLDGIMVLDRDGRVKHFNRRFVEMWGVTPEDLTSGHNRKTLAGVATQLKDPKAFIRKSLALHTDPETESFDVIEFKDGRIFERYTRPQHADGVSAGRVWCYRDVTERKRAEAEISYERDLLQTLLDSLPDTLYFKDLASRFVRVSRSKAEGALGQLRNRHRKSQPDGAADGYPPHLASVESLRAWLAGRTDFNVLPADDAQPRFDEEQEIIRSGRPMTGKIESAVLPDGAVVWHLVTKMPWRDEHGRIIGTYGISKNITAIKEAEEKLHAVHQELMEASRLAGMAEVATGVLHNVGNVLNSVNVSATLVREKLQTSEVASLVRVAALLRQRGGDLGEFLAKDPKGKLIPGFVIQLADHLAAEHAVMDTEHEQLARNVEHIKEIVAMQQTYARVSGVLEMVRIVDVLEDALQINIAGLARHRVEVVRRFADVPAVLVDKHKVMQILVNLIHNAKYALDESTGTSRRITLSIERRDGNRIGIVVTDTGVGIPPENLMRVFSHGFTTRRNGHGFGLHSGAIAAREMGGLLRAESAGLGQGATFTLELPLDREATNHE